MVARQDSTASIPSGRDHFSRRQFSRRVQIAIRAATVGNCQASKSPSLTQPFGCIKFALLHPLGVPVEGAFFKKSAGIGPKKFLTAAGLGAYRRQIGASLQPVAWVHFLDDRRQTAGKPSSESARFQESTRKRCNPTGCSIVLY